MSSISKKISGLVAMLLLFSLAACDNGSAVDGAKVVRDMQTAVAKIDTAHAVIQVHIQLVSPAVTGDITVEAWQQRPLLGRAEIKQVSINGLDQLSQAGGAMSAVITPRAQSANLKPADLLGSVVVNDGNKIWLYSPALHRAYNASMDTSDTSLAQIQALMQGLQPVIDKILAVSDVKGIGEEQVSGRDTYKIELTAKPGALGSGNHILAALLTDGKVTMWVDKELNVPLKLVYDSASIGQVSVTASNPQFNAAIDPDKFQFTPPSGSEVISLDNAKPRYMTLPQAQQQAGYAILVPTYLPDNATLIGVSQSPIPSAGSAISGVVTFLNFQGNTTAFDVTEAANDPAYLKFQQQDLTAALDKAGRNNIATSPVKVREVDGTAISFSSDGVETRALLYWTDRSGLLVSISGNLNISETLKLAESLK